LIIQGTNDQAVKMEEFNLLKKHFTKAKIILLPMPIMFWRFASFTDSNLPAHTQELVDVTKVFSRINDLDLKVCLLLYLA
jgi:hypothetical protein